MTKAPKKKRPAVAELTTSAGGKRKGAGRPADSEAKPRGNQASRTKAERSYGETSDYLAARIARDTPSIAEEPAVPPTPSKLEEVARLLGVPASEPEAMLDAFVALFADHTPEPDPEQLAARELTPAEVVRCRMLGWEPSFFLRAKRVLEEARRT